jgi:hypothetical protein
LTTEVPTGSAVPTHNGTMVDMRSHVGKTPPPQRFKGTDAEKMKASQWLKGVDDYFMLDHKHRTDDDLVRLFGQLLDDSALTWFRMNQMQEGEGWTLTRVYEAFAVQYAGSSTSVLLQSQLMDMQFSRKKDFTSFASQWQNLIAQLYPREWAMGQGPDGLLLGQLFADVIQRGDVAVWTKAIDSSPQGLAEWKAAVQRAITVIKVTDDARARAIGSSAYSTRSHPTTTVRVNAMEDGEHDNEYERGEGGTGELNQMQGRPRPRGGQQGTERRAPGPHLYTPEEFAKLKDLRLCFHCGRKGHRGVDCADRRAGKPKTKATAAQLNA